MNRKILIIFTVYIAYTLTAASDDAELTRQKRQLNLNIPPPNPNDKKFEITRLEGGGSRGSGFDISTAGRVKLWESQNKLNQIHGTGSYSQHLGGPWGNSKPNVGAGISFTRHF